MTRGALLLRVVLRAVLMASLGGAVVLSTRQGAADGALEWQLAGTLAAPRAYASAIALATGEVLVFGGLDAADPQVVSATSELFDPRTGASTVLPQLLPGRTNHSATVAWGDRVVVAGGSEWRGDHWEVIDRVDVFDPYLRRWLRAAPLHHRRTGQAAAALRDGRVLVAGGYDGPRLIGTAELYDPRTDTWTDAAPLPKVRGDFTMATLFDGVVLAAGGLEGKDAVPALRALYYDPAKNAWADGPPLYSQRILHASARLANGDVLLIGGQRSASTTAERYDARLRQFVYAGALAVPRMVATAATLPDGRVVVAGGLPVDPTLRTFSPAGTSELWDPATQRWDESPLDPDPRVRSGLVATAFGVFQLTGSTAGDRATAHIERLLAR